MRTQVYLCAVGFDKGGDNISLLQPVYFTLGPRLRSKYFFLDCETGQTRSITLETLKIQEIKKNLTKYENQGNTCCKCFLYASNFLASPCLCMPVFMYTYVCMNVDTHLQVLMSLSLSLTKKKKISTFTLFSLAYALT